MSDDALNDEYRANAEPQPPGTRNVLYVLKNGDPDEWALERNVAKDETTDDVGVYRFDDVPAWLADAIEDTDKPKSFWMELLALPHTRL